jgi:glycosyl transferase family 25
MRLYEVFDTMIVLTLPTRLDRRLETQAELDRIGWPADRVIWYPGLDPRSKAGFTTGAHRGAAVSHALVVNYARNAAYRRVLICEDDIQFADDWNARESEVADQLDRESWGIAYLGHIEPVESGTGLVHWPSNRRVLLTHCYALDAAVMPRFCRYLDLQHLRQPGSKEGGPMGMDGSLTWFRRDHPDVVTVMVAPTLANQRSTRSDLSPRWFDRLPVLSHAAEMARVVWRGGHRAKA